MRNPINALRYFFQKHNGPFDAAETERRNRERFNSLWMLDPDVLVRHLSAFAAGDICGLERVIEAFEERDDKMRVGAFKMAAAVASKPWEVRISKGEEENDRARLHQEVLTRFWNRIEATDTFCRNRRGGVRLLMKQMMSAQSRVFAVHDVCWQVLPGGELKATFSQVPAWCFENRSGRLRYIRSDGQYEGEAMSDGEWLVTVGEGVGLTATILAMAKRLSWNDWLLFSEKCGMPVVMGNTSAQRGTEAWTAMARSIRAVAPKTGILADLDTRLQAVTMGGASSSSTYRELIDTVDRAISSLYRGGDLATMSSGPDAAGVNAQSGESELMDADGCAMVAETLHDQIERRVIRFTCGDFEPLAGIYIGEPQKESVDTDMRIDQHLAGMGVKLSKTDALQRYNRAEATDDADALTMQQPAAPGAGLFNEKKEVSRGGAEGTAKTDLTDVIADAMAAEFAEALKPETAKAKNSAPSPDDDDDDVPETDDDLDEMEALANSIDENGMGHDDTNGQFDGSGSDGGSGGSAATPKRPSGKLPKVERSSIDDLIARETAGHADRMAKIKAEIAAIRARRAEARKAGKKKIEGLKAKREATRAEIMRMHVEAWKKRVAAQQAAAKNKARG